MGIRPFLLGLLPFLAGCSLVEDSGNDLLPLPSGLTFTVRPAYDYERDGRGEPLRGLVVDVRTDSFYSCVPYLIAHTLHHEGGGLAVRVRGIDPPDWGCFQALGPAEAKIVLGERRGTFGLRFDHGGETDRFEVRVVSDSAAVTPKGGTFVRYAPLAAYYPRY